MFNVVFYKFNKRPNSTKRPTSLTDSATFACTMKTTSSLTSPIIDLKMNDVNVPGWNYCYIADLGQRYYYIERTYYDLGVWSFQLTVDVLGTYYNDIYSSSQYIARSATNYNADLIDTMYPLRLSYTEVEEYAGITISGNTFKYGAEGVLASGNAVTTSDYFNRPILDGFIVLGVKGNNTTGVTYYAMEAPVFNYFIRQCFNLQPSQMSSDTTTAFANAVLDPLQYVTTARWYPYMAFKPGASTTSSINVGSQTVSIGSSRTAYILDDIYFIEWDCQIDLPEHPQAAAYSYMKMAPYTELTLYMQPFGFIPLDTVRLYRSSKLTIRWRVDYLTGACTLILSGNIYDDSDVFLVNTYQYGVEVPISTLKTSWLGGLVTTGLQFIRNVVGGTGADVPQDVQDARDYVLSHPDEYEPDYYAQVAAKTYQGKADVDKMIDMVHASMGQVQTVGAVDSFLGYTDMTPRIYATFYVPVDMDIARFGRPYFTRGNMSNESGYVLCINASIDFSVKQPLPVESRAVIAALNSGIYLE